MIRLIIVEDERVIRNGIEKHVPFDKLGIDELLTAENATEALSICEKFGPDIIISDIMMPGMNGVDLCKAFKERLPNVQIIFISGYSDKEYLMAAISLGAVSYVEKPISVKSLSEAVQKAVSTVKMLREGDKNAIHCLLTPEKSKEAEISDILFHTGKGKLMEHDRFFSVIQVKMQKEIKDMDRFPDKLRNCMEKMEQEKSQHFLEYFAGKDRLILLVSDCHSDRDQDFDKELVFKLLALREPEENWFVGAGGFVESKEKLQDTYEQSEHALKCLSYKGWNSWACSRDTYIELTFDLSEKKRNEFYRLLVDKKKTESEIFLNDIYNKLLEEKSALNFNIRSIYYHLNNIALQADRILSVAKGGQLSGKEGLSFLDNAQTIQEIHIYVQNHVLQILEEADEDQKNSFLIKTVVDYMRANLDSPTLSIQTLSDVVYLTPTYLSSLFKKHTGSTINHFMTRLRIEKAQELLRDPRYKLYHVAELVGYEDPNYFAKLFKKYTGMLPSQYRENKLI